MHATTLDRIADQAPAMTEAQRNWRIAAIALLSIRVIQGFIYWGGGSRRFIYAPSKLDPSAHSWMANKFQTAMPGALLGTDHLISFLLTHFYLLYAGVILFSAAELIVGAMLMTGLLTRLAALFSMGFSVLLMLMFGWPAGSVPLPQTDGGFRTLALAVLAFVVIFDVGTYNYYRGSVLTPFHGGPVSPTKHHLTLSQAELLPDGSVRFHVD